MPRFKIKSTHKKTGRSHVSYQHWQLKEQAKAEITFLNGLTGDIHKHLAEYTREVIKVK